jgi:hypothetical protein
MDKIPWDVLGPVGTLIIVILIVVFVFVIKMKNGKKPDLPTSGNPETLSKKSLCFEHEGRIKGCETNIENISTQFKESREDNRKDHKDLFEKIDEMGKDIIRHLER